MPDWRLIATNPRAVTYVVAIAAAVAWRWHIRKEVPFLHRCSADQWKRRMLAHNVYLIEDFVSHDEMRQIRSLASTPAARDTYALESDDARDWDDADRYANMRLDSSAHRLLPAIEDRIGCLVGIAPHEREAPLMLEANRVWPASYNTVEGERNSLQNLHHDKHQGAARVATVVVFLSGDAPSAEGLTARGDQLEGGHTLFPCVRPAGSDPAPSEATADLCGRLLGGFDAGHRILYPAVYQKGGEWVEPIAAEEASELCHAARDADAAMWGSSSAPAFVGVRPQRGSALLYWSASPDDYSHGYRAMWNGGCRVWRGEKWTLQKFKEIDLSQRIP